MLDSLLQEMYSSLIKCSCHRLGRRHLPSALRIAHLPSAHPALLADRSFHTSFALQLRKAPNSVSKIFGVPVTYIPWPSHLLKALIRKYTKKETFGSSKFQFSFFHRISLVYFILAWSALGLVFYGYSKQKEAAGGIAAEYGTADWYYLNIKNPAEIKDAKKIKKYTVDGFFIKEDVEFAAKVDKHRKDAEVKARESDDPRIRSAWGLTLRKADQAPLDAFREQKRLAREKKLAELEADNQ